MVIPMQPSQKKYARTDILTILKYVPHLLVIRKVFCLKISIGVQFSIIIKQKLMEMHSTHPPIFYIPLLQKNIRRTN
jgi:hypothetical protein